MPDSTFRVWLGGKQDPHTDFIAGAVRVTVVRRHRAWWLVVPVPAQGHRDRRAGGPQVSVWLHHQDCLVGKCSAHHSSVLALEELSEE